MTNVRMPQSQARGHHLAQGNDDQVLDFVERPHRSILGMIFPDGVRLQNIGRRISLEFFGCFGAPVKIELAVDDLEYLRVYTGSLAGRRKTPRSISSVLRSKTLWIGSKQIPVLCVGEIPFGIVPTVGKRIAAFHRKALSVVGNRVIAFNGYPEKGGVDQIECYRGNRCQYKDRSDQGDLDGLTGSSRWRMNHVVTSRIWCLLIQYLKMLHCGILVKA